MDVGEIEAAAASCCSWRSASFQPTALLQLIDWSCGPISGMLVPLVVLMVLPVLLVRLHFALQDKDGVSAAAVFAEMAASIYRRGSTVAQHLQDLYKRYTSCDRSPCCQPGCRCMLVCPALLRPADLWQSIGWQPAATGCLQLQLMTSQLCCASLAAS